MSMHDETPKVAQTAVFLKSSFDEKDQTAVIGEDFKDIPTLDSLAAKMITTGFQATNVSLAINEINRMLSWRLSDRGPPKNDGTGTRILRLYDLILTAIYIYIYIQSRKNIWIPKSEKTQNAKYFFRVMSRFDQIIKFLIKI